MTRALLLSLLLLAACGVDGDPASQREGRETSGTIGLGGTF